MAYADVYNASIDETFQGRCLVAVREIARAITAGEVVTDSAATNLVTLPRSEDFAKSVLRNRQTVSKEQIAILIMANTTIAGNIPNLSSVDPAVIAQVDSDILWQTKEVWPILVEIG